jgi:hypothetical protein
MDADAELREALDIMFTVTASGLLVIFIIGTGVLHRTRRSISALLCSVLGVGLDQGKEVELLAPAQWPLRPNVSVDANTFVRDRVISDAASNTAVS